MDNLLTILIQTSAVMLAFSSALSNNYLKLIIAIMFFFAAPFIGRWLTAKAEPRIHTAEKLRTEKKAKKAAAKVHLENREQIGFIYLKSTFLCAGYIAHADGTVCRNEKQLFTNICIKLQLEQLQKQAAYDYFTEARAANFNIHTTINEFIDVCGNIEALCENFLQTQFSFIEASGMITHAELNALKNISNRLQSREIYENLLQEYQIQADEYSEHIAQQRVDAIKRERDKNREEREKQRIEDAKTEQLKKLSPAQRKLYLAFATLGLKPTMPK